MKKFLLASVALILTALPLTASAHTTLISSDPVHDTTIQSWPDHLTLTFGEPLQVLAGAQINKVSVTNAAADGHVLDGEFTFSYKKDAATTPVTTVQPHHGTSKNFALVATSTVLIVIGLLFGIFIYRRK